MSDVKLKALRYDPNDEIGKWIEKQDNYAVSMRLMIKSFIKIYGYIDVQEAVANIDLFSSKIENNKDVDKQNIERVAAFDEKDESDDSSSEEEVIQEDTEKSTKKQQPKTTQQDNKSDSGDIDISMLTNVMNQ